MENRKYKVCRNDVYVGKVIKTSEIYQLSNEDMSERLRAISGVPYRSILFVPDNKDLADDLLYRSPSYPILNLTDDEMCLSLGEESIVVNGACPLAQLLEYYDYPMTLSYEDIKRIRKAFFYGHFAKDNSQLFGYKEIKPEDWTYFENGQEITNPKKLQRCIAAERHSQKLGHRNFVGIADHELPREYFDILDELGNNSLLDILRGFERKIDSFTPPREEGPILKLKKF